MKTTIRKWLGIEDDLSKKADIKTEKELRKLVGEAFVSALAGKSDRMVSIWEFPLDFDNTLTRALERASADSVKNVVEKIINTEAFLDSVVKRIMDKQLRG